jgi:hypothetical protein
MSILIIILFFLLGIATVLDLKFKAVPSVFLTGLVFLTLSLRIENLAFGVLACVLMLIVHDIDKSRTGIADFKVMAIIGFLIPTFQAFVSMTIVFIILQVVYVGSVRQFGKWSGEIPFLPCLYATFVGLALSGVLV